LTTPVPALPDSYLRAILALPGDDGPRLCAADWWDEQGVAERAEFVRVQCELAALDAEALTCESEDRAAAITTRTALLRRRERELAVHCAAWAGTDGVMKALGADRVRRLGLSMAFTDLEFSLDGRPFGLGEFRRGFVEKVTATAADFLAHADALTAACPLRKVRLTTWPEVSREVDVERKVLTFTLLVGPRVVQYRDTMLGVLRYQEDAQQVVVSRLLKAAFPGITFEMPTVELRPGSLSPSQVLLTTDGAPALADPRTLIRGALP
jgi:uncharacterized protein (TIGR02996 family)